LFYHNKGGLILSDHIKDTLRGFIVPIQVLEDAALTVYEKMVYIVLRSFINPHRSEAWPSIPTISRLSGVSRTQVKRSIESLMGKGYITRVQQRRDYDNSTGKARQTSNIYTIDLPQSSENPGPDRTDPQSSQDRPPVLAGPPPQSSQDREELINSELIKKNDDDDRLRLVDSVFDRFKNEIDREKFNTVVKRVGKYKSNNFEAFLVKAIQTEIANIQAAASSQPDSERPRRTKGSKKPQIAVVTNESTPAPELTAEKRAEMRELAARLRES
jgi:hypothetical protein